MVGLICGKTDRCTWCCLSSSWVESGHFGLLELRCILLSFQQENVVLVLVFFPGPSNLPADGYASVVITPPAGTWGRFHVNSCYTGNNLHRTRLPWTWFSVAPFPLGTILLWIRARTQLSLAPLGRGYCGSEPQSSQSSLLMGSLPWTQDRVQNPVFLPMRPLPRELDFHLILGDGPMPQNMAHLKFLLGLIPDHGWWQPWNEVQMGLVPHRTGLSQTTLAELQLILIPFWRKSYHRAVPQPSSHPFLIERKGWGQESFWIRFPKVPV